MRAFYYRLDSNNAEQLPANITCRYQRERNLLKYGIPRNGRWSVHIHRDFARTLYQAADKVVHVDNGRVTYANRRR